MSEKLSLQLRFDADNPAVQRTMPVLDLLARKKALVVAMALDEFFAKYGLYGADGNAVRKFVNNYEYIRDMHQQLYSSNPVRAESPPAATIYNGVSRNEYHSSKTNGKSESAPVSPLHKPSYKSHAEEPVKTSTDNTDTHFDGDPEVSDAQKEKMKNMMSLFGG